jgi:two-component system, NarL family, response regulator
MINNMETNKKINIMVADDHPFMCEGLVSVINAQQDMRVVATATNGRDAVSIYYQYIPDIAMIDLRMPIMNGIEVISTIRAGFPESRLIVLTMYDGDEDIHRALQAGAKTYLLKSMLSEETIEAIRNVYAGKDYLPKEIKERLKDNPSGARLTRRELDVLTLIVKGKSNRDISKLLNLTEGTVKWYVKNVLGKLEVSDRTQATTVALARGIVHLD